VESRLITPIELRKRVPMVAITDFMKLPLSVQTPDFVLRSNESSPLFSLHSLPSHGKPWEVVLRDAARGAWRSEVDGSRMYYFAGYTGAAGSGPDAWILALSFDAAGQPVPFFFVTHGSYDAKGIEDVLDLDGDGPEFLQQDYWGNIMDDPGCYVTTLYKQRGVYWRRSDGRHGAHLFPTFEKWSVAWKDRRPELIANPPSGRPVRDYSNDPGAGIRTTATVSSDNGLRVGPESGCGDVSVDVLVTDDSPGRKVKVLEPGEQAFPTLAQAKVTLTGLYHWPKSDSCSAAIMWTRH
jgi:hypothetical protein